MIKISLTLDYEDWTKFWESINGQKMDEIIADYHCICWSEMEVEEQ